MRTLCLALLVLSFGCQRTRFLPAAPPVVEPEENDGGDTDGEDADAAARYFLRIRVPPGETELPLDRYDAARLHIAGMPVFSAGPSGFTVLPKGAPALAGRSWVNVGPGNIGGRMRSLVVDPQNTDLMYAGAVTGGVWKTTDGGKSWTQLTDTILPVLNIGSLAMDPFDSNTIYAGTGEYASFAGQGIFKTNDAGATWRQLPATAAMRFVNRMVASPKIAGRLYAATETGIWSSSNAGATWQQSAITVTVAATGCRELVIRTDTPRDYLFANCSSGSSGPYYGIWRNTDAAGAGAWERVFTANFMNRTSLALAPSQQSTIYAMASSVGGIANHEQGLLAVYRSTSNGDPGSWIERVTNTDPAPMNTVLLQNTRDSLQGWCNGGATSFIRGQGTYDNVLAVDPLNPEILWAGGIDLFRSDDGGANWGVASLWQIAFGNPQYAHADRHVIAFHPAYNGTSNQTLWVGSDGGLFRTDNARAAVSAGPRAGCQADFTQSSAVRWTNLNNNFVATQFRQGVAYQGGQAYFAGSQDNSVSRGRDITGVNGWLPFTTGDGSVVAIDPADANSIFFSLQNLSLRRSVDGGSFVTATSGITEDSTLFPFVPVMGMDPNEGRQIYLGGTTNLWRSLNGGVSWTSAAPVEASSGVSSIAVSPFDSNTVMFGTNTGFIYRSSSALTSDGTTPWEFARPRTGNVQSLAFDPADRNIVYANYSNLKARVTDAHIYKSYNGGVTWAPMDGTGAASIPDLPTHRLLVDPHDHSVVYVGSDLGLFVSTDGGASWARDPGPFGAAIVDDLAFDQGPDSNYLFAFTFGRGAFRSPLATVPQPLCTYSVNPTSVTVDGYGGVTPITVTAPAGCAWVGLPGASSTSFGFQAPAQGTGSGTAYLVSAALGGTTVRTDTLTLADNPISVRQTGTTFQITSSDSSTAPAGLAVPGLAQVDTRTLTSAANDPVHSCTGSADFKSAWWSVTPSNSGTLQVRVIGRRFDIAGNSGIVVTAYERSAPAAELGCAVAPRDTAPATDAVIRFRVTAGTTYLIEVSATGSTPTDGGATTVIATMGSPDPVVSVTPASASVTAGSSAMQFTSQVTNAANPAVRWSIAPPVGTISPAGLYTPPESVSQTTTVTITATSFFESSRKATAAVTVSPGASAPLRITQILSATGEAPPIAQNTWIEIKGSSLAQSTRIWQGSDFVNGQMPTALDGVTVTVNGKPAYIYYISPAQVNVLTPLDTAVGPVEVRLTSPRGEVAAATATMQRNAPGFFVFNSDKYLAATHPNGSLIGPASLYPGATTPARPGETVVLYGNGFGQTNPSIAAGSATQVGALPAPLPVIRFGTTAAMVTFAGVVSPGLYQFNVVVPATAADGDNAVSATYNGFTTQPGAYLTVQR